MPEARNSTDRRLAAPGRTRFSAWTPAPARLLLALVALLAAYGAILAPDSLPGRTHSLAITDLKLYATVAARVAEGEGYYAAAAAEHRRFDYPLKPFVAMRQPALALLVAGIGPAAAAILLVLLAAAGATILTNRVAEPGTGAGLAARTAPALLCGFAVLPVLAPDIALFHEAWASALVVLALACRGPGRYALSLALGLAAVAVREWALVLLVAMAGAAWWEGRRRETAAWATGIAVALALYALHAASVAAIRVPDDLTSQGWVRFGGWSFVLAILRQCSGLILLPAGLAAALVPFGLLGWLGRADGLGLRGALVTTGTAAAFTVLGRPDNVYWGLFLAPPLLAGLAFAPAALRDLVRAATPVRRAITGTPAAGAPTLPA